MNPTRYSYELCLLSLAVENDLWIGVTSQVLQISLGGEWISSLNSADDVNCQRRPS
jgi:hypothetical protein